MRFEWDEAKNLANKLKHGVSFEAAASVFFDPNELTEEDLDSWGEQRWRTIGRSDAGTHLLVIHAERGIIEGELLVRIISARVATSTERKRYEREVRYR